MYYKLIRQIMTTVSFRPEEQNLIYMISSIPKKNRSKFINESIKNYRKFLLKKELREWFSKQWKNDLELSNLGLQDYISLLEKDEL